MGFLGKLFNRGQSKLACNFCCTLTPSSSVLENCAVRGSALLQPWDIHVSIKVPQSRRQNIKLEAQVCDGITHLGLPFYGLASLSAMFSYSWLSTVITDIYPKLRYLLINLKFPQCIMILYTAVEGGSLQLRHIHKPVFNF